jgi:hypothetical protein
MGLAAVGMGGVLWGIRSFLMVGPSWMGGFAGIAIGGLVYVGLAYALRVDELRAVLRRVKPLSILKTLTRLRLHIDKKLSILL